MWYTSVFSNLEAAARRRRHDQLRQLLEQLKDPLEILDVGGTIEYWSTVSFLPAAVRKVVLFNTFEQNVSTPFEAVSGDARDLSRYRDNEFDIVFSNSVIGHVGNFADQQKMAREIRRVGRTFFLQTPNHGFPLDWRTFIPFFHFLPEAVQAWCFRNFSVGTYRKALSNIEALHWATRIRNIRRRELELLFPGLDVVVIEERVLGFTKSFMVHNFQALNAN